MDYRGPGFCDCGEYTVDVSRARLLHSGLYRNLFVLLRELRLFNCVHANGRHGYGYGCMLRDRWKSRLYAGRTHG